MADWAELPKDVIELIAKRVTKIYDHLQFGAVCSSWRSVAIDIRYYVLGQSFPKLVIPGETNSSETRRCLTPITDEKGYFCFLENNNNELLLQVPHEYYCCGSSLGWLVLIDNNCDMQLVNPLSRVTFKLPSSQTLPPVKARGTRFWKYYLDKAVISSDPTSSTSSQTIVLIIYAGAMPSLAFCKLGDESWTAIESPNQYYLDAIYYKEKFYAVYSHGGCDIIDTDRQKVVQYALHPPEERFLWDLYVVESKGELYLAVRVVVHDADLAEYYREQPLYSDSDDDSLEQNCEDESGHDHNDDKNNAGSSFKEDSILDYSNDTGGDIKKFEDRSVHDIADGNNFDSGGVRCNFKEDCSHSEDTGSFGDLKDGYIVHDLNNDSNDANGGSEEYVNVPRSNKSDSHPLIMQDIINGCIQDHSNDKDDDDKVVTDNLEDQNGEMLEVEHVDNDQDAYNSNDSGGEQGEHVDDHSHESDDYPATSRYKTMEFGVYKLEEKDGIRNWVRVRSIGDNAFFVGYNSSFALQASDYIGCCKPNSIYFTDSRTPVPWMKQIRHDIGIFNLENKSVDSIFPVDSKPVRPPPFWFTPNV